MVNLYAQKCFLCSQFLENIAKFTIFVAYFNILNFVAAIYYIFNKVRAPEVADLLERTVCSFGGVKRQ